MQKAIPCCLRSSCLIINLLLFSLIHAESATNLLVNGNWSQGESGWVRWKSPLESTLLERWTLTNSTSFLKDKTTTFGDVAFPASNGLAATAFFYPGDHGHGWFGWYQAVQVPIGQPVILSSADWAGSLSASEITSGTTGEIMLLSMPKGTPPDKIVRRIINPPTGAAVYKRIFRVSAKRGTRDQWEWQPAALSPIWHGTNAITSQGMVIVVLQMGSDVTTRGSWVAWDNLVLEPAPGENGKSH